MGRSTANVTRIEKRTAAPSLVLMSQIGGHGKCLRRTRDEAVGEELDAYLVKRNMVNVGTNPGPPLFLPLQGGEVARPAVG
jgi:hypothetical protein